MTSSTRIAYEQALYSGAGGRTRTRDQRIMSPWLAESDAVARCAQVLTFGKNVSPPVFGGCRPLPRMRPIDWGNKMPAPGNVRNSRDPDRDYVETTDFSWGPGLVPRGYENYPPSMGGQYRGTCPPVERTYSPDLSVRVVPVVSRRGRRPDGSPNGYPGERAG